MSDDPLRPGPILTRARFGNVALQDGTQFALQAGTEAPRFLDGVFDSRTLTLAETMTFPFVGTRWKLIDLGAGAWQLACQGDPEFSLYSLDNRPFLGRAPGDGPPPRAMQWLLFRLRDELLLRSLDGYWLGHREGRAVAEHVDDLADPAFHWHPVAYR